MAVPSGDQRDWNFAKHFNLSIIPILDAQKDIETEADNTKQGQYINSGIINGMTYADATNTLIASLEERGLGKGKVQYRLRNAVFSRQRYWGEPVPVYWKEGVPYLIEESELPLELPAIDEYLPTETGEPPLGRATDWKYKGEYEYELSTMPGWAGSSWYFYRYMDAHNDQEFASKESLDYWRQVDLYVGGTEHAVGHLLYSRFWNLFMYDLGLVPEKEYAKKLLNQGMIQGRSLFLTLKSGRKLHVQIQFADEKDRLSKENYEKMLTIDNRFEGIYTEGDINWQTDEAGKQFVVLSPEVEKMSKSKYNVVNPDDMVAQYGADCFRMYEMFLGPITDAKPWSTGGITGVAGFLRKFWSLFYDHMSGKFLVNDDAPTKDELKILHTAIKKVNDDIEKFGFNTCVSAFMVCVNELKSAKCSKRLILNKLTILLAPFAPFIAEEAWEQLGNTPSVLNASYPVANEEFLVSDDVLYPISINGKKRGEITFPTGTSKEIIEATVPDLEVVQKWVNSGDIKKIVVVPGRMINVVI